MRWKFLRNPQCEQTGTVPPRIQEEGQIPCRTGNFGLGISPRIPKRPHAIDQRAVHGVLGGVERLQLQYGLVDRRAIRRRDFPRGREGGREVIHDGGDHGFRSGRRLIVDVDGRGGVLGILLDREVRVLGGVGGVRVVVVGHGQGRRSRRRAGCARDETGHRRCRAEPGGEGGDRCA